MTQQEDKESSWLVKIWRIYLGLGLFLGLVSLIFLLRIPSETAGRLIFGLTPPRLAIAALLGAILILFGWLLCGSWWKKEKFATLLSNQIPGWGGYSLTIGLTVSMAFLFGGMYALLLTPEITEPFTRAYFIRLAPIFFWITALSLQNVVILLILRARSAPDRSWSKAKIILSFLLIIGVFFGIWSWLTRTQFESESKVLGWNETGAPILETQVLLAW
jgi:hypothetical protein